MIYLQIILLTLLTFSIQDYQKLSPGSSVKVIPNTKVYLDLSSYEIGDLISFEIELDLFFGHGTNSYYSFYIDQVPATSYYDSNYWGNLRLVNNYNKTCSFSDKCEYTWEEIKGAGNNYIYIIPPAPFDDFYSFWGNKIKISVSGNGKGLSGGAIAGIVIGVIIFIAIIVVIIVFCCIRNNNNCCVCCHCCGFRRAGYNVGYNVQIQQQPIVPIPVVTVNTPIPIPVPVNVSPQPNPYIQPVTPQGM